MNNAERMTVDVIIPTYRPGVKFRRLLDMLKLQTRRPGRIIVMNTEDAFWNAAAYEDVANLEVHHLTREEFDHGGTRGRAVGYSAADAVLFLTDDAVPADEYLIERLTEALGRQGPHGETVIMAYARQLPEADCGYVERYTRSFNYPERDRVKTAADLQSLGIKTYFASNVCCMYDRKLYLKMGGFITRTIFNEDMIFAGHAVQAGYGIAYAAGARVIHSHNYTNMQQFHRNFDLAVSQADHPEVFGGIRSESEGVRLVKSTAAHLAGAGKARLIPGMVVKSGCKYLGFLLGRRYRRLPMRLVRWCSMNKNYWT